MRRIALAGFVGINAPLDAPHHRKTHNTAKLRLQIERALYNQGQRRRKLSNMHHNDNQAGRHRRR